MGDGKGGGGGGATLDPALQESARQSTAAAKEILDVSRPVRELLASQITEALKTGGVGARLPLAQASVEASKSATSSALSQTRDALTRSGVGRTPFGQNILADLLQKGNIQTEQIPVDIAGKVAGLAPNFALGAPQAAAPFSAQGLSGAQTASQLGTQANIAQGNQMATILASLLGSQAASKAGGGLLDLFGGLFGGGGAAAAGAGASAGAIAADAAPFVLAI